MSLLCRLLPLLSPCRRYDLRVLRETVVLRPQWLIDATGAVIREHLGLHRLPRRDGIARSK